VARVGEPRRDLRRRVPGCHRGRRPMKLTDSVLPVVADLDPDQRPMRPRCVSLKSVSYLSP
jgi:hypothetical protein